MTYVDGNCTREPSWTIDDAVDACEITGMFKNPGEGQ